MSSISNTTTDSTDTSKQNGASHHQGTELHINSLTKHGSWTSVKDDEGEQLNDVDEGEKLVLSDSPSEGEFEGKSEIGGNVNIEYVNEDKHENTSGSYKWIVVFGCFIQHFITGGFERSDGVLYLKLISRFQQSAQATAWPGSLASTVRLCLGPLASAVSNRYSSRVSVIVGGLIMAVGVIISGFAPNLLFLYFSFGVIGGVGRALSYAPGLVTVGQYFAGRPGLAVGLATSGVGAGTFVIPPLFDFLFEEYTFMGAFLILGALPLNLCVCGALYRPLETHRKIMEIARIKAQRKKEKYAAAEAGQSEMTEPDTEILLLERNGLGKKDSKSQTENSTQDEIAEDQIDTPNSSTKPTDTECDITYEYTTHVNDDKMSLWTRLKKSCKPSKSTSQGKRPKLLDLSLLKNPSFLLFCFSICLFTLSFKSAFTFLPALAKSRGCTEWEAALLMSVAGVVDTIGRILAGLILDFKKIRKFRPVIYNGVMFFIASLSFVAPTLYGFWAFALLCGLFGAMTGAYVSQKSVIIVDILGVEKLTSSLGLMIFFQGIGTLIGPPLSGVLKDVFGDYTEAFYFGGGCTIFAAIIMIFSNILLMVQRRKQLKTDGGLKEN